MGESGQKVQKKKKKRRRRRRRRKGGEEEWHSCSWSLSQTNFSLAWQEAQILCISLKCVPMTINSTYHCLSTDTSWQYIPLNHILLVKQKNLQLLWEQSPSTDKRTNLFLCEFAFLSFCLGVTLWRSVRWEESDAWS